MKQGQKRSSFLVTGTYSPPRTSWRIWDTNGPQLLQEVQAFVFSPTPSRVVNSYSLMAQTTVFFVTPMQPQITSSSPKTICPGLPGTVSPNRSVFLKRVIS